MLILQTFNSFHNRLQFTLKISNNNSINFLDITLIIDDHGIIFDQYKYPTHSSRYINFHFQHPLSHKKGIVYDLIDRILSLSHPKFHKKNLKETINILLNNYYLLPFIFSTMREHTNKTNRTQKTIRITSDKNIPTNTNIKKDYFTIPYINNF